MNAILAITFLMIVYMIGEVVALKTKAMFSATLVIAVVMLISFWCGLPADIMDLSQVSGMGMILVSFLITSLGTTMDFTELKNQWKTVVVSISGVIIGVALIILIGSPIIGRENAFAGAPIFAGGNAAALILKDTLTKKGLDNLFNLSLMVLVLQNFIGIPIASFTLRREAKNFLETFEVSEYKTDRSKEEEQKKRLIQWPKTLDTPIFSLIRVGLVSALGFFLSQLSGGAIHPFVGGLLLGIVFTELGFLESNMLNKTDSSTFILFTTTVVIFSNLATVTPTDVLTMLGPTVLVLGIGIVGVVIGGLVLSKLLNIGTYLAITLGLTCTFGFPTTLFMSKEVSKAMARNEQEEEILLEYLMPKMLTAGFVTVTIASAIIAGFVVKLL